MTSSLVFRKGLDLKDAVAAELNQNYYSDSVQQIKANNFQFRSGRLTIHLAREFGSATASTAPSTMPIRRASDFPIAACS